VDAWSARLNPYFIGLSILISSRRVLITILFHSLNPYFIGLSILIFEKDFLSIEKIINVSILILLDYLFL